MSRNTGSLNQNSQRFESKSVAGGSSGTARMSLRRPMIEETEKLIKGGLNRQGSYF
jgi:hypothetical protein